MWWVCSHRKIGPHCSHARLRVVKLLKHCKNIYTFQNCFRFLCFCFQKSKSDSSLQNPESQESGRDGSEPASLVHSSPVEGVVGSLGSVLGWLHTGSSTLLALHGGLSGRQPLHLRRRRLLLLLPCMRLWLFFSASPIHPPWIKQHFLFRLLKAWSWYEWGHRKKFCWAINWGT